MTDDSRHDSDPRELAEDDDSGLLAEQRRYYAERAPEYDSWWRREGRYDLGPAGNRAWARERGEVQAAIRGLPLAGSWLELAGGTGNWTELLARRVDRLTVIDAAPSMIALNRDRIERAGLADRVRYRQLDLFCWTPQQRYDGVFFGFWLSHVPHAQLEPFWQRVAGALRSPDGLVAFVDNQPSSDRSKRQGTTALTGHRERRELSDGRSFTIVKRFDDPDALADRLFRLGFEPTVRQTERFFLYGWARKR